MTKQVYIDPNMKSGDVALEYVLNNNGNTNDAAVRQAIASITGGSYQQASVTLARQHKAQLEKGDTAGAEATADAMAYFNMKRQIEYVRGTDHKTTLEVYSYQSLREGAVASGNWNRVNDDQRIANENAKAAAAQRAAHAAEVARVEAARVAALSPRDRAIEEVIDAADRPKVRQALKDANGKGRSLDEVRVNLHNSLEDRHAGMFDWHDSRQLALKVLDRQEQIQSGAAPSGGLHLATPAAAATLPAKAPAAPAAATTPAHPTAPAAAAPAQPAAPAAPAAAKPHHSWTPIEKQVQYDLEVIGSPTGQKPSWKLEQGVDSMDGKNGPKTGGSIKAWLEANHKTELDADAIKLLHTQALAKTAAAAAVAAGAGAGRNAGTPAAPAAGAAPASAATGR